MALDQAYPSSFFLQFNDKNGKPFANGTLKTFLAGDHSMPVQTWTYPGSGVKNPTSIVLDEAGRCTMALDNDTAYYVELYDSENALQGTWDNVTAGGGFGGGSGSTRVQSDWAETDPESPAYIKNKPKSYEAYILAKGDNTQLTDSNLNQGLNTVESQGSYLAVENGVLKIKKKGVYHVDVDVRITGATVDPNDYEVVLTGYKQVRLKQIYDNTYEHDEVIHFAYEFCETTLDSRDIPLTITHSIPGAKAYIERVQAFNVHPCVVQVSIYTGGTGININEETKVISADFTEVQKKLTPATDNVSIDDEGNISVTQEQADWNETDDSKDSFIKNKPDMADYARIADLAAVAFSADYEDLTNKPDLSVYARIADLAAVAFSGAYSDLSGTPDLSAYVPHTAVCPNWVSGEACPEYTYRWYNGKVYRNRFTYTAGSSTSTIRPDNTLARVWVEVPIVQVGNTIYHYFATSPTLSYYDIEALISTGYNLVLIGNNSLFEDYYGKAFTIIGKGDSFSTSIPYRYYSFAALNSDGSGMKMLVAANKNSGTTWYAPSASFGKVYTAGTGISLTGPNNTEINCTLDPFPAHTAANLNWIITVNAQNQLIWKQLSFNDLANKPEIPDPQVNSDWDETDPNEKSFILNKPNPIRLVAGADISIVEVDNTLVVSYTGSGGGGGAVDDVTVNGSSVVDANHVAVIDLTPYALASSLAAVATSGAYSDLSGTPDLSVYALISSLSAVATSGDYADLSNKPDLSVYALASALATVATSGSYADLSNKPDLSVYALASSLAAVATSGDYTDLSNKPDLSVYALAASLAAVATSGDYNDLSNKPTIPTITYTTSQEVTDILADLT